MCIKCYDQYFILDTIFLHTFMTYLPPTTLEKFRN